MQNATGPTLAVAGTHAPTRINTTNTTLCTGLESHLTHSRQHQQARGGQGHHKCACLQGWYRAGLKREYRQRHVGNSLTQVLVSKARRPTLTKWKMEMGGETRCADWAS